MPRAIQIAPSILAADFGRLAEEVRDVENAGADLVHVDVMDGNFVPNLTVGVDILRALRRTTSLPLDVHLMVADPDRHLEVFADAGADIITVHYEAAVHLQRTLHTIRRLGKRVGVALNPHTPESVLTYVLGDIDLVLVMSVNPGFTGQVFLPQVLPKITAIRDMVRTSGHDIRIGVDGGIEPKTVGLVTRAGADVLVAGAAVYRSANRRDAIESIRALAASD
jgi:ribulose-phosphate 3-epimerase